MGGNAPLAILLQLRVLALGLLQNRYVGVGVFPESEEILIGSACFCCVTQELVPARLAENSEGNDRITGPVAVQVADSLEFVQGLLCLTGPKVGCTANIDLY